LRSPVLERPPLLRQAQALLALAAALLLPSLHVAASHHDLRPGQATSLVAAHPMPDGAGARSGVDSDTCSLCRAAGQARHLIPAAERRNVADAKRPARGHLPRVDDRIAAAPAAAVAGPRAPPAFLPALVA
jgi:hypothetical protein